LRQRILRISLLPSIVAVYWAAFYTSVPLVLWAIGWGKGNLERIHRIINFNLAVLLLALALLFVIALLYLDFGSVVIRPASWFKCDSIGQWYVQTNGNLRGTGVGRYAALASLIAIGGIFSGRLRLLWGIVLFVSLLLLLSTGARTAFAAFAVAAPVLVLFYGSRRTILSIIGGVAFLILVIWLSGIHNDLVRECLLRGTGPVDLTHRMQTSGSIGTLALKVFTDQSTPQESNNLPVETPGQNPGAAPDVEILLRVSPSAPADLLPVPTAAPADLPTVEPTKSRLGVRETPDQDPGATPIANNKARASRRTAKLKLMMR